MNSVSDRPGLMIYFDDVLPLFDVIGNEATGRLFRSIVLYGKYGEVPDFSDAQPLAIAWGFIKAKIDRDASKYEGEVQKRKYATYCREVKKNGEEPLSFNEWHQMISSDTTWYPTVTGTVTGTAMGTGKVPGNLTKTAPATAAAAGKGEGNTGRGTTPPPPSGKSMDWEEYEKMRESWRPH